MIRPVTIADIPQITEIYNYYILQTVVSFELAAVSEEEMARRMRDYTQTGPYLVYADAAGQVLGYCYAHPWKERQAYNQTYETTIYLHPDHFRKGIGTALLRRLIEECQARPIHALIACITAGNTASIHLHEQYGFRQVSLFPEVGYKLGKRLDVVDYELILNDSHDDDK